MKKNFLTIIIMIGILVVFSSVSYAEDSMMETALLEETELPKETELFLVQEEIEQTPSQEEIVYLSEAMGDYEIGGEVTGEILYDRFDAPKFLMGITEKGYLILYRDTLEFLECGEGHNPYYEADNSKIKYYGGFACYCIPSEGGYLDLRHNEIVNEIPYLPALDEIEKAGKVSQDSVEVSDVNGTLGLSKSILIVQNDEILPNADDYIRRLAFGNNDDDTCMAISLGIVLNYLDRKKNNSIVPSDMKSERLQNVNLASSNTIRHPKAEKLHRYLVDTCGIHARSMQTTLKSGLDKYRNSNNNILNTEISLEWSIANVIGYIVKQIDLHKPAIISTTLNNSEPKFNKHAMAVYGYKRETNYITFETGIIAILVHTGWDGEEYISEEGDYAIAKKYWFTPAFINCGYRFNYTTTNMNLSKPMLSASSPAPKSINLKWNAVKGAEYYKVYFAIALYTSYILLKTVKAPKLSMTHTGLKSNVIYKYKIVAAKKVYGKELVTDESYITTVKTLAKYRIEYNVNGGKSLPPKAQIKIEGKKLTLRTKEPTRKGHYFVGWSTDPKAKYATYKAGGTYKVNASAILYAVWRLPKQYTIKYNLNGASGTAPSSQTKTEDVKLILRGKKPSRTGYTFLGWSKNSTAKSAAYSPGGVYKANAPATLYAVWKIKTYSVYYSANGGSMTPSAQTKIYGKTLTLRSKIPTRKGHTFLGWSKSSTASRSSYQPGGDYKSNSSVTLYAVWKADTFKVKYSANGGIGTPYEQTKTYDVPLRLSDRIPKRTGYIFLGWSTSRFAKTAMYIPRGIYYQNKEVILYAVWKK